MLIEDYIQRTCSMVPSLNCLVFNRDGEDIYIKSYGLANIERKIKATIETSYGIGSITKIFTALSIFKLIENKPNILDSYIYEYFNNTKLFDTLKNSNIKIKHLLSHTTGISSLAFSESRYNPNYFLIGKDINKNNIYDILQNININKVDSPGKNFRYLNIGYILLGIIIEKISKIEYESYVEKNIFKTLGMNSTCFSNASLPSKNIATPYIVASSKINTIGSLLNSEFQQAGGIVSNLTDLKKLIISLLSKDSKNKIIKDITFKKMCRTQKILKYNTSINKTYSGLFGSLFISILVSFIFFRHLDLNINYLTITFILSIISQIGDLLISFLKRKAKIKATGKFLPGHGGLLDRVDGILFAIPIGLIIISL